VISAPWFGPKNIIDQKEIEREERVRDGADRGVIMLMFAFS
jgi:hypothetical protein